MLLGEWVAVSADRNGPKLTIRPMLRSHELVHAFDQSGRQYGPTGRLEDWWTNVSSRHHTLALDATR